MAGALGGLLSVSLGAFAAHGLKSVLTTNDLQTFQTAVEYQFYHSLALILVSSLTQNRWSHFAGWLFITGIIIFCGSLYILVLMDMRMLGMITPIGGIGFIMGWTLLFVYAWQIPLNR